MGAVEWSSELACLLEAIRLDIHISTSLDGHATAFADIFTGVGKSPLDIALYSAERFKPVRSCTALHRNKVMGDVASLRIFLPQEDTLCGSKKNA
jgi:hypothetical protein